ILTLKPVGETLPCHFLASGGCWQSLAFLGLQMRNSNLCLHCHMCFLCLLPPCGCLLIRTPILLD
uniref:Uncharacterized protein n=1 Tax=Sus scrofa TaxID=9823 RepID=A0A4X1TEW9_PIG